MMSCGVRTEKNHIMLYIIRCVTLLGGIDMSIRETRPLKKDLNIRKIQYMIKPAYLKQDEDNNVEFITAVHLVHLHAIKVGWLSGISF